MKVRFGVGIGADTHPADFSWIVDQLEKAGVDSLWLSEHVYSGSVDPLVGLAHALSRTSHLKVGTSVAVLPGRHPALVAKPLATLAALAPKRVLPVFGLRPAREAEHEVFRVPAGRRAAVFDESLRLLRLLLTEPDVDFTGEFFSVHSARIGPTPNPPLDLWLGGSAAPGLRRVGRYGDGWLGSFLSPGETRRARETIQRTAAEAGREIEADHFGISVTVAPEGIPDRLAGVVRARRSDTDPSELIAGSWPDLHRLLDDYVDAGLTKFVIHHVGPERFDDFLDRFATELLPRQN
jgi:probable F420-dependent oxidoreductase